MNKDLETLLTLQAQDGEIRELQTRLAEMGPRLRRLDDERNALTTGFEREQAELRRESAERQAMEVRVAQHRALHERNVHQLDSVTSMREVTAGQAQVATTRQLLAEGEHDLGARKRRVADLESAIAAHHAALANLDAAQAATRDAMKAEHSSIEQELAVLSARRAEVAGTVPRTLLAKYDRIRVRRDDDAVFALRGTACGSCDSAVPMQRRSTMTAGSRIEVCEECGVLLYAAG